LRKCAPAPNDKSHIHQKLDYIAFCKTLTYNEAISLTFMLVSRAKEFSSHFIFACLIDAQQKPSCAALAL
jgi:hypothetical protein